MGGKPVTGADGWPIRNGLRRWGLFGPSQQAAGVTAAWIHASVRRWGETWIPKYERSLFLACRRGAAEAPGGGGLWACALRPKGVEFGFLASFFSTSLNKKKTK